MSVSVALCTRNGERFVAEQLRSILGGTVLPDEIVVGDDASADRTVEILRAEHARLAPSVPLTILENDPPLGVTGNFARTLAATSGDIVVLSDQDDVWARDRVARLLRVFDEDPRILLVHSDARLVDGEGAPQEATLFDALELTRGERDALARRRGFDVLVRRNVVTGATAAVRRSLIDLAAPFPEEWVHDEWLALHAAVRDGMATRFDAPVDYRQHGGNVIGQSVPTLRYKLDRVLGPRGDRNAVLAQRWAVAARRLAPVSVPPDANRLDADRLDAYRLDADRRRILRAKARFEELRRDLPPSRVARAGRILGLLGAGAYGRFASRGRLDVVRDLLQQG